MKNKQTGFTLIELLISVAILSALLFTGTYSYQMLANSWEKDLGQFNQSVHTGKHLNLLYNVLSSIQPAVISDIKANYTKPAFFFIGFNNSLLSITRSGLFSNSGPEVFRISAKQKENGLYDLIYQASTLDEDLVLTSNQVVDFKYKIILLHDLESVSFNYLGWDSYMDLAEVAHTLKPATWRNKFSGIDNQLLPMEMKIELVSKDKNITFYTPFDRKTLRYLTPYLDFDKWQTK